MENVENLFLNGECFSKLSQQHAMQIILEEINATNNFTNFLRHEVMEIYTLYSSHNWWHLLVQRTATFRSSLFFVQMLNV